MSSFKDTLWDQFVEPAVSIGCHTAVAGIALGAMALLHRVAQRSNVDQMLFGTLPLQYVLDLGHLLVFVRWLVGIAEPLIELFKKALWPIG